MRQSVLTSTFMAIRHSLRQFAAVIVGDDNEADEVVHDAFCRLWATHPDVADDIVAAKLSYTAVKHLAIYSLRHSQAHPSVRIGHGVGDVDPTDEPDEAAEREATYKAVIRLSEKILRGNQLEVFRMHDIQGMSYDEVGALL